MLDYYAAVNDVSVFVTEGNRSNIGRVLQTAMKIREAYTPTLRRNREALGKIPLDFSDADMLVDTFSGEILVLDYRRRGSHHQLPGTKIMRVQFDDSTSGREVGDIFSTGYVTNTTTTPSTLPLQEWNLHPAVREALIPLVPRYQG